MKCCRRPRKSPRRPNKSPSAVAPGKALQNRMSSREKSVTTQKMSTMVWENALYPESFVVGLGRVAVEPEQVAVGLGKSPTAPTHSEENRSLILIYDSNNFGAISENPENETSKLFDFQAIRKKTGVLFLIKGYWHEPIRSYFRRLRWCSILKSSEKNEE